MLRDLDLKRRYRSNEDNLASAFYVPCLSQSHLYSRAVGYFSSAALGLAALGLPAFLGNGGRMRLIASPELSALDIESMEAGYQKRQELLDAAVTGSLTYDSYPDPTRQRLGFLGWMIEKQLLDIKIAIVANQLGFGIYHEKVGIFEDRDGNRVAFHGSANESRGGLEANFESIIVFRSWVGEDREDVDRIQMDFDALWSNETHGLEIHAFPEAAKDLLRAMAPVEAPPPEVEVVRPPPPDPPPPANPRAPSDLELREYQRAAMAAWFSADGRGILEMATGTGKTMTALAIVERLFRAVDAAGEGLFAVVICPYQHLVRQWEESARRFGLEPILCFRSRHYWQAPLAAALRDVKHGYASFHIAIATNATFGTPAFQTLIADMPSVSLVIADEAHNLGAESSREALPENARYRLGLSATPERWLDDEGTDALFDYFGPSVFKFGLEEALDTKALTPYYYRPVVVELDGAELDEYIDITQKLGRFLGPGDGISLEGPAKLLLIKRARILANAGQKIPALWKAILPFKDTSHNLIYCGDGTRQHDTGEAAERQLDAVLKLLGHDVGMRVHRYTAETALDDRDELRDRFAAGDLQGLVAIRCLDEGVDIPATERAFILASSTNPRQFIQRRGRVLRPSPGTGKTSAEIFDFLAVPPPDSVDANAWQVERRLVQRELERVTLFADLAQNGPEATAALRDLRLRYDLLHI